MRKILNGIKTMFLKWKEAFFSFCRHPIQYTKDYFKNFKTLSCKEKICKILWAAADTNTAEYSTPSGWSTNTAEKKPITSDRYKQ